MLPIKQPLGTIDTRLAMSDTPEHHVLSPSFASILDFNEREMPESPSPDELSPRPCHRSAHGARCPRLELEAAMDKFYTLDGFAEGKDPQNTPATESGTASHDQVDEHPSADQNQHVATPSSLKWLGQSLLIEPQSEDSQTAGIVLPSETQSSVEHEIPSIFHGSHPCEPNCDKPLVRSVRFSPPTSTSPKRPLPSIERKRDYAVSHRQSKPFAKWKRAVPGPSPSRSPISKANMHGKRHGTSRSPRSNTSSSPHSPGELSSLTQNESDHVSVTEKQDSRKPTKKQNVYDMIVLNFGVYGPQYPERLGPSSQWAFMRLRMNPTFIAAGDLCAQPEETKQIVCRLPAENLLFHFVFIIPAFVARRPHALISFIRRMAGSPLGLNLFTFLKFAFFWITRLVNLLAQLFWDMELGFQVNINHRYPDRGRLSSR